MKALRYFPQFAFILVMLSMVGVTVAQHSVGLLLVAGTLSAMSWFITEGPHGRTLPRWVSNVLIIGLSLHALVEVFRFSGSDHLIGVMGRFGVWLTVIKLYERKRARDYGHLLLLSLLMVLTGCLSSASLVFGVIIALYGALALFVLMMFQMYHTWEAQQKARSAVRPRGARPPMTLKPIVGTHSVAQFRLMSIGVGALAMAIAVLSFVAFPRNYGRGMLREIDAPRLATETGYTDEVNLISGTRIGMSRDLVCTVQLTDPDGRTVVTDGPLYLRGAVLEKYDGDGRWRRTERPGRRTPFLRSVGEFARVPGATASDNIWTAAVSCVSPTTTLFAPAVPLAVDAEAIVAYVPDTQILTIAGEREGVSAYAVQFDPNPSTSTRAALLDDAVMHSTIDGWPHPAERFTAAAIERHTREQLMAAGVATTRPASLRGRLTWQRQVAETIEQHFADGDYIYDLDLSGLSSFGGRDPLYRFIFEVKRGHCEYFASAMTAMCASVGAQARLVTGYVTFGDAGAAEEPDTYSILASNAHAWVEVRTGVHEWQRFDPTPPSQLELLHGGESTLADRLRWMYQQFEGGWNDSVVQYDNQAQAGLAAQLEGQWSAWLAAQLRDFRVALKNVNERFNLGPAGYIWMAVVAISATLTVIVIVRLVRRWRQIRRAVHLEHLKGAEYQRMVKQVGFYLDMLDVLHKGKATKPAWQPPRTFARALRIQRPELARLVETITDLFYRVRYGGESLSDTELSGADDLVGQLATILEVKR